jgi:hypothetical protein
MSTLTLEKLHSWFPAKPEGVSLLGLPAERSAKRRLPGSADDVLRTISSILNDILEDVIARQTAASFEEAVDDAFPRYVKLVMAFAKVASAMIRPQTLSRLASESFSELESDIRTDGLAFLGEALSERAIFTVWTLRKTSDMIDVLAKSPSVPDQREKDVEFHQEFFINALWSRFHIDCLIASMRTQKPIYPDVMPLVDNGLRSAVNAYAWAKQAVDLRFPTDEYEPLPDYWSEDDQQLLDASMRDLDSEGAE